MALQTKSTNVVRTATHNLELDSIDESLWQINCIVFAKRKRNEKSLFEQKKNQNESKEI